MKTCSNCGEAIEGKASFCPSCGTQLVGAGKREPLIGQTFNGKYRVLSKIGAGGMGTVYLGEHIGLRKRVALKVLKPELQVTDETLRRFQREGIAAGKFSHPSAIQIFDFDRAEESVFYLAMEYVEGHNLKVYLREHGRFSVEDAIEVVRQVLGALAEAHRHGIVHRDIKPENIMIVRGATGEIGVKVLDFGLSKLIDLPPEASMHTQFGQIVGTPLYMAPEQSSGEEVDHRSDLYSVALILYELIGGTSPFAGLSVAELLVKHVTAPPPPLSQAHPELKPSRDLEEFLERALERHPEDRFQSATEMLSALDGMDLAKPARRRRRRRPAGAAAARGRAKGAGTGRRIWWGAAVGVALVVAAGLLWVRLGEQGVSAAAFPRVSMKAVDERSADEARYVGLLEEARTQLAMGDLRAANARVEEAQRLACRDSEAYLVRAQVYRARRDLDPALADLREALRLDPGYSAACSEIGWIEIERGDIEAARASFEEAAQEEGAALPLAGLGKLARLAGDHDLARETLEHAIELDSHCGPAQRELGLLLLEEGEIEDAIFALTEAKRLEPRSGETWAALGEAYVEQGRDLDAKTQLLEAHALAPDLPEPVVLLASLLSDDGRYSEALEVLEPALGRHPEWRRAQVLAGLAYEAIGATVAAGGAPARGADDARATTLLGVLRQRAGRLDDALELYESAIEIDRSLALPHLNKGLVLFAQERYDEAGAALRLAADLDATNVYAQLALGIVCMDYLADRERAVEALTAYQDLGGDDPRVAGWLRRLNSR